MIAIVDYGLGNLRSVEKALALLGATPEIVREASDIDRASAIILPGVGAFESGMEQLRPLIGTILDKAARGTPLLGICLGMQMLYEESEEGRLTKGLGLVPGRIERFSGGLKVPHMGWNSLSLKKAHPLMKGIDEGSFVYFVHSYRAAPGVGTVASSDYGGEFTAIVANGAGNVAGTQFHPEKSGNVGLRMLKNFIEMI